MDLQQGQAIPARLLLVGLQLALELFHPRPKLRHRLDLALVAERGLVAPYHLAHRVLRNPQIPGDLLDRNAPHQMIPTDLRDRFHNQHLPPTPSVQTTRCVHGHKTRGVKFGRRSPPIGGQCSTLNNSFARCTRRLVAIVLDHDIASILQVFPQFWVQSHVAFNIFDIHHVEDKTRGRGVCPRRSLSNAFLRGVPKMQSGFSSYTNFAKIQSLLQNS